jgi:TonB family protein
LGANLLTVAGVNPIVVVRRAGLLLLLAAPVPALVAQNLLFVKHGGHPLLVRGADGMRAIVEIKGKLTSVSDHLFALKPAKAYLPIVISVRHLKVQGSYINLNEGEAEINHDLRFNAGFVASYRLDNVFLLLDMDPDNGRKAFFLWGIGRLDPHVPKEVSLSVPLGSPLGAGHYHFHLFVGGAEVLHSHMPFTYREQVFNRMVAKKIDHLKNARPKPFVAEPPEYPAKLLKSKTTGSAVISIRIMPNGVVLDPKVVRASDPAFGESAITAIRLWRFLPEVKDGQPVECRVSVPFNFDSSKTGAAKS